MDDFQPFKVLIVDDDTSNLEVLLAILQDQYTVYFAKSGQSAIEKARQNRPDIILLDVVMPDMTGFEVLSILRQADLTRTIPVIIITGLSGATHEVTGFDLGAVDYITKPFHSEVVKARIKSHLETQKQLRGRDDATIIIKTRQEVRNLYLRELVYVDVSGHWLHFHLSNGSIVDLYATLKEYEEILLSDPRFVHSHKSYIINMDYVEVIELRTVLLKNGEKLPISKRYMDIKKQYIKWINMEE